MPFDPHITSSTIPRPIYSIDKTYSENIVLGPNYTDDLPPRRWPPEDQWIDFMGFKVASPIGVPAGPLLSSKWIALASGLGFDIVTYKTIRSHAYAGHPLPNVIFVEKDPSDPLTFRQCAAPPENPAKLCITNSFGMPSMSPDFLCQDIRLAKESLKKGQILIVSVTGSPESDCGVIKDFITAALLAKDSGADIVEANFSCPNVGAKEGSLYCDPDASFLIADQLSKAISPLPLLVKVGAFPGREALQKTLTALARANARGVCGINTIPSKVLTQEGQPALGVGRETSGICGDAIRAPALDFIRSAREVIQKEHLDLELAGCGGIMLPEHFDDFLTAGAKIALTATGMMWNPYLATQYHQKETA